MRPRHRREKKVSRCSKERKEKGGEGRRKKAETTVQSRPALIWLATETVGGVSPALFFSFSLVFFFPVGMVFSWFLG
jgi:hypothetical protein